MPTTLATEVLQTKRPPTMQEIKFDIGRFPLLSENVFLKNYLEHDKDSKEIIPSVLEVIKNIQSQCSHEQKCGTKIAQVLKYYNCADCGKDLAE